MYYQPHFMGMGPGWTMMVLLVVLPLLLLAVVLLAVPTWRPTWSTTQPEGDAAEMVLSDRFARGEIDAEEYEQRLRTLRAGRA